VGGRGRHAYERVTNKGGLDLASCAAGGTQFCGDTGVCPLGQSCAAMNDLSLHQTEYTAEESTEDYGSWTVITGVRPKIGTFTPILSDYSTIPVDGAHTAFGSDNEARVPVLSSNSLRFSVKEASGDWINIYNTKVDNKNVLILNNSYNVAPETKDQSPVIGSYPLDLVGLYYFGKAGGGKSGSASVTYQLDYPKLLLLSQIDRVIVKVLSNGQNGLCRYNAGEAGGRWKEAMYDVCKKTLFGATPDHYGYNPENTSNQDDENFAPNGWASYVSLASTNNWSYQLSSSEGSATFKLLVSADSPKRVTGIQIDLEDNDNRGYVYVGALDVHMAGPVCGEAAYVGSSNPTAEDNTPKAFTNSVNNILPPKDFSRLSLNGGTVDKQCYPWGAYASTNPLSIVTLSGAACELAKGAIYAGVSELQKIFAAMPGIGQFMDTLKNPQKEKNSFYGYEDALQTSPTGAPSSVTVKAGSIDSVAINNVSGGDVWGRGSLRADLKFFARADKDQMPIKGIKINWGDDPNVSDIIDSGTFNYYKNHLQACKDDTSNDFGLKASACETKPFSYAHVYSGNCANPVAAPVGGAGIGIKQGDPVCIYTPSITIIDNWAKETSTASSPVVASVPRVIVAP